MVHVVLALTFFAGMVWHFYPRRHTKTYTRDLARSDQYSIDASIAKVPAEVRAYQMAYREQQQQLARERASNPRPDGNGDEDAADEPEEKR